MLIFRVFRSAKVQKSARELSHGLDVKFVIILGCTQPCLSSVSFLAAGLKVLSATFDCCKFCSILNAQLACWTKIKIE